jgi:hypothetical protein
MNKYQQDSWSPKVAYFGIFIIILLCLVADNF